MKQVAKLSRVVLSYAEAPFD